MWAQVAVRERGGTAMYETTQSIRPIHTVFGASFIPDLHVEGDQRQLPTIDHERRIVEFVRSLRDLGLRRKHHQPASQFHRK
jgi:hypothetical protein